MWFPFLLNGGIKRYNRLNNAIYKTIRKIKSRTTQIDCEEKEVENVQSMELNIMLVFREVHKSHLSKSNVISFDSMRFTRRKRWNTFLLNRIYRLFSLSRRNLMASYFSEYHRSSEVFFRSVNATIHFKLILIHIHIG